MLSIGYKLMLFMKYSQSLIFSLVLLSAVLVTVTHATQSKPNISDAGTTDIGETLATHMNQLMQTVAENATELAEDKRVMYKLLEDELSIFVSFTSMARRTMGKHFRSFSRKEQNAFLAAFKRNLFSAYVQNFLDEQLLADLPKTYVIAKKRDARFTNKRRSAALQDIAFINKTTDAEVVVTFALFYSKKQKAWFVRNLIVDGINLGVNYRNQFNNLYVENGGNMNAIIAQWGKQEQKNNTTNATTTQ